MTGQTPNAVIVLSCCRVQPRCLTQQLLPLSQCGLEDASSRRAITTLMPTLTTNV